MDADELDVVTYLKSWGSQFVSGREIARRAAGKRRFQQDPNWAVPILSRLLDLKIIESDSMAHYRLAPESKTTHRRKRWLSPEIKKILEKTGKDFDSSVEIEDNDAEKSKE
jgi:hypothetical protein